MILIFPCSALTGTEEPAGTAWAAARIHHGTSRAGGAEEASPGTAARRGRRRARGETAPGCPAPQSRHRHTAEPGQERHRAPTAAAPGEPPSQNSGRTPVPSRSPGPIALTALPSTSAILNRPRPPAPQEIPFTIVLFSRGGGFSSLSPPPTHTLLCLFFFFCYYYCLGFFTAFNTHCSKIPPPPPSPSGSRRRRFNSHFPTTGRIINLEADSPRFVRDHLGEKK